MNKQTEWITLHFEFKSKLWELITDYWAEPYYCYTLLKESLNSVRLMVSRRIRYPIVLFDKCMNCEVPMIMQGWVVFFPLFNNFLVRFLWWKWQFYIKQMPILAVLLLKTIEKYTFLKFFWLVLSDYHNIEFR